MPRKDYKTITIRKRTFGRYLSLVRKMEMSGIEVKSMDVLDVLIDRFEGKSIMEIVKKYKENKNK